MAASPSFGEVAGALTFNLISSNSVTQVWTLVSTFNTPLPFSITVPSIQNLNIVASPMSGNIPANSNQEIIVTVSLNGITDGAITNSILAYANATAYPITGNYMIKIQLAMHKGLNILTPKLTATTSSSTTTTIPVINYPYAASSTSTSTSVSTTIASIPIQQKTNTTLSTTTLNETTVSSTTIPSNDITSNTITVNPYPFTTCLIVALSLSAIAIAGVTGFYATKSIKHKKT